MYMIRPACCNAGVGDDPSAVQKGNAQVSDWPGPQAGSTAVVALCDGSSIALANVGDARAVSI
jgi:serine/threonine protein phosphatase PrpC